MTHSELIEIVADFISERQPRPSFAVNADCGFNPHEGRSLTVSIWIDGGGIGPNEEAIIRASTFREAADLLLRTPPDLSTLDMSDAELDDVPA